MFKAAKALLKNILPYGLIKLWRSQTRKKGDEFQHELSRIHTIPRYSECSTRILGPELHLPDSLSFVHTFRSIFVNEIYKFPATHTPYILDCGANIGLALLYFKQLYPDSKVVAFEPDPSIFRLLKKNCDSFSLKDVTLINKALWSSETTLQFHQEGADGGSITSVKENAMEVETVRLGEYLEQKVDLLKIDIEGAELTVIHDCRNLLKNVERLFVEFHSYREKEQELHLLLKILHQAGFRVHIQSETIEAQQPFVEIKDYHGIDMLLNIFAQRL